MLDSKNIPKSILSLDNTFKENLWASPWIVEDFFYHNSDQPLQDRVPFWWKAILLNEMKTTTNLPVLSVLDQTSQVPGYKFRQGKF